MLSFIWTLYIANKYVVDIILFIYLSVFYAFYICKTKIFSDHTQSPISSLHSTARKSQQGKCHLQPRCVSKSLAALARKVLSFSAKQPIRPQARVFAAIQARKPAGTASHLQVTASQKEISIHWLEHSVFVWFDVSVPCRKLGLSKALTFWLPGLTVFSALQSLSVKALHPDFWMMGFLFRTELLI